MLTNNEKQYLENYKIPIGIMYIKVLKSSIDTLPNDNTIQDVPFKKIIDEHISSTWFAPYT